MSEKIEYRVRPVTRFVVTRYRDSGPDVTASCEEKGEFDNQDTAFEVANALCLEEHGRAGTPVDDPNFVYPKRVEKGAQIGQAYERRKAQPYTGGGVLQAPNIDAVNSSQEVEGLTLAPTTQELAAAKAHEPAYIKISFCPAGLHPKGYMQASSSFPAEPGETWRRGNDLPDGPFNAATFQRILESTKQVLREHGMEG